MFDFKEYIKEHYNTTKVADVTDKNDFYDYVIYTEHRLLTFELKERSCDFGDILVELMQKTPKDINNIFDNTEPTVRQVHVAIGWFYKCDCNRLLYVTPDNIYDIDWREFKHFVCANLERFKMLYSDKTTGTWNLKIPIEDIPRNIVIKRAHKNIDAKTNK